jgi:hypothetical protein
MTFPRWIRQLPDLSAYAPSLRDFLHLVELAAYGSKDSLSSFKPQQIYDSCAAIVQEFSLSQCQKAAAILRDREKSDLFEVDRSADVSVSSAKQSLAETGSKFVSAS